MTTIFDMMSKQLDDSVGQLNVRNLQSIIDNEAKEFAIYTVENRAIPNLIDGFKPVQRFVIARALDLSRGNKEKFHKLASVAGGVADLGYHHGEGSAQDAGALMANTWNNNYPLLDGQGNLVLVWFKKQQHLVIFSVVSLTISVKSIKTLKLLLSIKIKSMFRLRSIFQLFQLFF